MGNSTNGKIYKLLPRKRLLFQHGEKQLYQKQSNNEFPQQCTDFLI